MTLQTKTIVEPELADVLSIFKQDILASLNCVKVGQIQSYDATKKTASIQILFKRVMRDLSVVSYPQIVDCPVVTIQGGGAALQLPVAAGDQCLVFFSDRRLDEWYQNGAEAAPGDPRMHDMSDGICLVGLNALNSSLAATPTNKAVLTYHNSRVEVNTTGLKLVATGGAEIDLDTIVTIKNNITTLNTLLGTFLTALEGLQVNGPIPLTAASIASIEAFRAQFAALLG